MSGRLRKSARKLWKRRINRLTGGRRILVIGDSHGGVFEYCFDHDLLAPHLVNCEIVAGATAYGLNNDRSATGAWQKFAAALERFSRFDVVVIVLGECDCSYALWKKSETMQVPPADLIPRSLQGIRRLVGRVAKSPFVHRIVLVGASLPSIEDGVAATQENPLRREIAASQKDRTDLVVEFNRRLAALAAELGVGYFDLTEQTMNPQSRLLDRRYAAGIDDHHLSHAFTADLWAAALREKL